MHESKLSAAPAATLLASVDAMYNHTLMELYRANARLRNKYIDIFGNDEKYFGSVEGSDVSSLPIASRLLNMEEAIHKELTALSQQLENFLDRI